MKFEKLSNNFMPEGFQWPKYYTDNKYVIPGHRAKVVFEDDTCITGKISAVYFGSDKSAYVEVDGQLVDYAEIHYPEPTEEEKIVYDIIDYGRNLTSECIDYSAVLEFINRLHNANSEPCEDKDENFKQID